jgi:hypothetical protein
VRRRHQGLSRHRGDVDVTGVLAVDEIARAP